MNLFINKIKNPSNKTKILNFTLILSIFVSVRFINSSMKYYLYLRVGLVSILLIFSFWGCNAGDPYVASSKGTMAIVNVSPLEDATNVPVSSNMVVTFENAIDITTLNEATVKLSSTQGTTIPGKVTYDPGSFIAKFTPVVSLTEGTNYQLTVSNVKGANEEFIPPYVFHFTTAKRFLVERYNPRDDDRSVKVVGVGKQDIFVQFNESVDSSRVSTANFYAIEQSDTSLDFENIMPATVIYDDTIKQLILKPERGRLKYSTNYFVVLRDVMSVNNGMFDQLSWQFRTEEIRVSASEPSANAINVSTDSAITLYFQTDVDKSSIAGNVKLRKAFGMQEEIFFIGEPDYHEDENIEGKITFKTSSEGVSRLESSTRYEIIVDGVISTEKERFKEFRSFFTTAGDI